MEHPGKKKRTSIAFISLCLFLLAGCVDQNEGADLLDGAPTDVQSSPEDARKIRNIPEEIRNSSEGDGVFLVASLSPNPNNVLSAIATVELSKPLEVAVAFKGPDTEEQITGYSAKGLRHQIAVVGMRAETTYTLTPEAVLGNGDHVRDAPMSFTTGSVPEGIPDMEVIVHQPEKIQPGITLLGPINPHTVVEGAPQYIGVDSSGAVVWYFQDFDPAGSSNTGGGHLDREARQLPDGNILLALPREYRIVTPAGDTVRSILGEVGVKGCNVGLAKIHHDADIMPNGNALVLSAEFCTVDGTPMGDNILVKADTIYELNAGGEEVWEWHALNVLDSTRFPGELSRRAQQQGGTTSYDWSHANAITYMVEDDSILMSFRHQNWVVKIDRTTKRLRWILGDTGGQQSSFGFSLTEGGSWFYSQHAPVMSGDGRILIYDNGNERPDAPNSYSRAVIYSIDENTLIAEQLWEYRTEIFSPFLGDANWLSNGNVLITAGGVRVKTGGAGGAPKPGIARIVEVTVDDAQGEDEKVWELKTEAFVYRANRIQSFWPVQP